MSTTAQAPQVLPAGTWTIDPVHSQVGFAIRYHVGTFRGSFSPVRATLEVGEDGEAKLAGSVPVDGVQVQDENLAAHLRSPEFFDASRAPEISFASTAIRPAGEQIRIDGELTIKNITLPVTATGRVGAQTLFMDRPHLGLELQAHIDRTRFGVTWNNPLPSGEPALADEVNITAELFLAKVA
jgi:polyisoprenoid-binding protein YceI